MPSALPTAIERLIAARYLRTRGGGGFVSFIAVFSFLGVALGVAALIVVLSVMGGFRTQLIERLAAISGHVVVTAGTGALGGAGRLVERLKTVPRVAAVVPVVERQALATANGRTSPVVLRGLTPADLALRPIITANMVMGNTAGFVDRPGVLLGERLRQALAVHPGEQLQVISYQEAETGQAAPRFIDYEVLGSFLTGRYEIDSGVLLVPLDLMQEDFGLAADSVDKIEITAIDPAEAGVIAETIRRDFASYELRVTDWRTLNARYVGALQIERTMMFIILSLVILVAVMNIVACFTMLVRSKARGIAILRTMGASRGAMTRIFLLAGSSVGLAGTILGAALGLPIALAMPSIAGALSRATGGSSAEIEFIGAMPARVQPGEVMIVLLLAVALSVVAAVYPAIRAARVDPAEALRHD